MAKVSRGSLGYWSLVAILIGFGLLAIFSIGAPFLLTGLVLVAASPFRRRPWILWTALATVWSFVLGYLLVAPITCTAGRASSAAGTAASAAAGFTNCTSLLGVRYSGSGDYNPSLAPGFLAGIVVAALGGVVAWVLLRPRVRRA